MSPQSEDRGFMVLSSGMERAGTAWYYRLAVNLLDAAGAGTSTLKLRDEHSLEDILLWANCNVGDVTREKWSRLAPLAAAHRFVVKTHHGPNALVRQLITQGSVVATYIYRDPLVASESAWNRGRRNRELGSADGPFLRLKSPYHAIAKMKWRQMPRFHAWADLDSVLLVRYEDLNRDPLTEVRRLAQHLCTTLSESQLIAIAQRYVGGPSEGQGHMHYTKDEHGGRRSFSKVQTRLARFLFAKGRARMGYC